MTVKSVLLASVLVLTPALAQAGKNDIVVGLDQKVAFEANGGRIGPSGEDQLVVVDVSDAANPRIRATLKLSNSVVGPPTNLQVTPDGRLALLASSVTTKETNGKWGNVPDDKLFVVDLDADPPKLIDTVTVGKQPSGLAISHDGKLALVANRAGKSVSVLAIDGTKVRQVSEVPIDDEVAAVAITPDGKRGFVVKNLANRIGVLSIDGEKVKYEKSQDMPAGYTPYNVEVTPDGKYALSVNQGGGLAGNVDTIVTIDAAANPPRVIDQTAVGVQPEGMAIGSNGVWVAVPLIKGSSSKHNLWSYTKDGSLVLMSLNSDGKLQAVNELPTGGVPEGVAFSPDSHYVYVGNYIDKNLQVYRIAGGKLADTGKTLSLPGQPASMRGLAR